MTEESDTVTARRTLQRVIFPVEHDQDVVPLYVETRIGRGSDEPEESTTRAGKAVDTAQAAATRLAASLAPPADEVWSAKDVDGVRSRRGCIVHARRRVSFGTYFNAFPASYWRRWTTVEEVLLRIRVRGEATIVVYRSTAKGYSWPEQTVRVDAEEPRSVEFALSLAPFMDGGWYWFDILAGDEDVTMEEADWSTVTDRLQHGRLSVGITTFNRPEFCVGQMRKLGQAGDVLAVLDEIFIVDQGTRRVEDHPDFAEATKGVADRLRVLEQGNLGGSGGFARVMDETLRSGHSDYVLLLDDDVVTEPESILRAATFADLARRPTIVGGHMFSLYVRSVLHVFGETIAPYRWFWGAHPRTQSGHDFAQATLRQTPWLHRRIDVDYNAWWMCLIPTQIIRRVGLALPAFIKWDDAEYGVRAGAAGYPTVTMPGVAVWHMPFHEKDDTIDWQAYFHRRNRILTALLHSPYEHGGAVITESLQNQIRNLLSMQYYPAEMALLAIEDLLAGPGRLHHDILRKMSQLRELRKHYADQRVEGDMENFPNIRRDKPPRKGKAPTTPSGKLDLLGKAALGATRQILPVQELARRHPQRAVPHQDAKWWLLSQVDSALVSAADGTGAAWYQRDPQQFRSLLQRSIILHTRLFREWLRLREEYRAAAPEFTSAAQWRETFETSMSRGS